MTIKLHSEDIQSFDPSSAIHAWNTRSNRSRRPNFQKLSRASLLEEASNTDISTDIEDAQAAQAQLIQDNDQQQATGLNEDNTRDTSDIDSALESDCLSEEYSDFSDSDN